MSADNAAAQPEASLLQQLKFLKPYWVSDEKWKARLMLGGIAALIVAEIALTAGVGLGFKLMFDALVAKQGAVFLIKGAWTMAGLAASSLAANAREYINLNLAQNWRGWLTKKFNEAWLGGKAYLRFQHNKKYVQNPDQRMTETLLNVTQQTLSLGIGLFKSVIAVGTFSVMLWHISPLMVGAATGAAVVGHAVTKWAGGSMRQAWRNVLEAEAKFRHALVRLRDNAKSIALAGLENVERETLQEDYKGSDKQRREFYRLNWRQGLAWSFNMNASTLVPIAMMAPKFFAGTATLGGLELVRQFYGQLYGALSWFPQGYSQISSWSAYVGQLMEFHKDLEDNRADITHSVVTTPAVTPKKAPAP